MRRLLINLRLLWRRILRESGTPEAIGRGVAVGIIVGMTPIIGLQMTVAALMAWAVRGNPVAAILPVWLTNPFTIPPVFWVEYQVGVFFMSSVGGGGAGGKVVECFDEFRHLLHEGVGQVGFLTATWRYTSSLLDLGGSVFLPMLLGGVVLGVVMAVPSYFVASRAVRLVRERRKAKGSEYLLVPDVVPPIDIGTEHDSPLEE